jgi:PKD repeat protein
VDLTYNNITPSYYSVQQLSLCNDKLVAAFSGGANDTSIGVVVGYDINSKDAIWQKTYSHPGYSTAAITGNFACNSDKDIIYVPTDPYLYALNSSTGQESWKYTGYGSIYNPSIANGIVYFISDTNMYALDETTGQKIFSYPLGYEGYETTQVAISDGMVYFSGNGGTCDLFALALPSPPQAAFSGNPTSGQIPLAVAFSDTSTGTVTSRSWDFGDGVTSTEKNPTHTYNTTGTYSVSLSVTGPAGTDKATKINYIIVTAPAPQAAFSGNRTNGPAPLTVAFSDASTGAITSRSWNFGDGEISTDRNPIHTFTAPGTYTVSLTLTGPGGTDTEVKNDYIVVAAALPTVTITAVDPSASELGKDTGAFQVSRTGVTSGPLGVFYSLTGSAKSGTDYKKQSGKVTIRAGHSSALIKVKPIDDKIKEKAKKVKIKLVNNPAYHLGSPRNAVVIITDND